MLAPVTSSTEDRRAVSFRSLAFAALVFGCLIAAGIWLAYTKLIHYERRAALHLPPRPDFVARLEVEQVALFEPVRRHLLPLINRLPLERAPDHADERDRLTLLRQDAGLNLAFDLREIVIATSQGGQDWVLVLGGLFPSQGLVSSIERALESEGVSGLTRAGDALLFAPWNVALGQASDGTLIVASDPDALQSALSPSTRALELGIPNEGPGSASLSGDAFRSAWGKPLVGDPWQSSVERVRVLLRLAEQFELDTRVELRAADESRAVLAGLERGAAPAQPRAFFDPRADWAAEWLSNLRAAPLDDLENVIKFTASWRAAELERNARGLASWLERQFTPQRSGLP